MLAECDYEPAWLTFSTPGIPAPSSAQPAALASSAGPAGRSYWVLLRSTASESQPRLWPLSPLPTLSTTLSTLAPSLYRLSPSLILEAAQPTPDTCVPLHCIPLSPKPCTSRLTPAPQPHPPMHHGSQRQEHFCLSVHRLFQCGGQRMVGMGFQPVLAEGRKGQGRGHPQSCPS